MSKAAREKLENITIDAMVSNSTNLSDKEFLFVCPIVSQAIAASRAIDILIEKNEPDCLGLICRQIFELLITLQYVFSVEQASFHAFCRYFVKNHRVGRYDKRERKWKNVTYEYLCDKYIKLNDNPKVKEIYNAFCRMSHFSLNHAVEILRLDQDTLEISLSGHKYDRKKICRFANIVQEELIRIITEAIQKEYLQ